MAQPTIKSEPDIQNTPPNMAPLTIKSEPDLQDTPPNMAPPTIKAEPDLQTSSPSIAQPTIKSESDLKVPANIPDEFTRSPSGSSIIDPDSTMDESGRTYHTYKQGKYFLPNDSAEQERLDIQHAMLNTILDGHLALAPIQSPKHVMDVACGTGIWALDFAEQNPDSHVVGIDLSAIQPDRHLANCEFIKEDAEEEWLYSYKFDYIHLRMVVTCFNDPRVVLSQAVKNLNPGGWIEYQDIYMGTTSDDGSHIGTTVERWMTFGALGLRSKGRDPYKAILYTSWLEEAGLVDIQEYKFKVPMNGWSDDPKLKKIGQYALADTYDGARGISWQIFRGMGWEPAAIEEFIVQLQKDMVNRQLKCYTNLYVVFGRKPFEGEVKKTVIF